MWPGHGGIVWEALDATRQSCGDRAVPAGGIRAVSPGGMRYAAQRLGRLLKASEQVGQAGVGAGTLESTAGADTGKTVRPEPLTGLPSVTPR